MTVTDSAPGTPSTGPTTHEGVPLNDSVYAPGQNADGDGETGLDFFAGLKLQLGDLTDRVGDLTDQLAQWRKMQNEYPAMIQIVAVLTYSNTNPNAIAISGGNGVGVLIGGPDQGRCWSLRNVIAGPVQVTGAAPAGAPYFLVSAQPPQALSLTDVRDFGTAFPYKNDFSARQVFLNPNENLYMVVAGAAINGTQFVVSCAVQDEPYRPDLSVVGA